MKTIILIVATLLCEVSARGQTKDIKPKTNNTDSDSYTFVDGNELFQKCDPFAAQADTLQTDPNGKQYLTAEVHLRYHAYCNAYIMGVTDSTDAVCIPQGVSTSQLREMVVNYLKEHPESRHRSASLLVIRALAPAFSCSAKSQRK